MNREYHKWHSPALQRDMELLVFGHAGPRMLVFPTRKQRFYEFEDHGMVHSLRQRLKDGELQLICVDGIDEESLYCFDVGPEKRIARHLQYERYIIEEIIPFCDRLNPGTPLITHGSSFGAYHAMTIAMRHPRFFSRVIAFSGRYDLTLNIGDFHSLFHGYSDPSLNEIMPTDFMPVLKDTKRLRQIRKLRITLVIGEDDPFYEDNTKLCAAFALQKVKHEFHVWSGNAHRFRYWRQMIRVYL